MYAAGNSEDVKQYCYIQNLANLCAIGFNTGNHAECCYKFNYDSLLELNDSQVRVLQKNM